VSNRLSVYCASLLQIKLKSVVIIAGSSRESPPIAFSRASRLCPHFTPSTRRNRSELIEVWRPMSLFYYPSRSGSGVDLSPRQFERRFLAQVGIPPKLYARIIRFNAALDNKLRLPSTPWSRVANEHDYYDQMHLVHDPEVLPS
jgi:hypothetical protein